MAKFLTEKRMIEETGLTTHQLRRLRRQHPGIYRYRLGDKVDSMGRTVRRGIQYDLDAYNKLFKQDK